MHADRRARINARALACALLVAGGACGGKTSPPPQPGQSRGTPPDLRGRSVLVLPVQQNLGIPGDPNAELAFALSDRGGDIDWVLPAAVDEMLARSPSIDARTTGLPVGPFLSSEVRRIGDPLYGQLRRLAALVEAELVLLPIALSYERNQLVEGSTPRVRLTMSLVEPRTGQVLWFGIEEGGDFGRTDPRALASAVEESVRTLLWYLG